MRQTSRRRRDPVKRQRGRIGVIFEGMPNLLPLPALGLVAPEASWVGPVGAISLVIIAVSFLVIATAVALMGKGVAGAVKALQKEIAELRSELEPTLRGLREAAAEGRTLVAKLQHEVEAVVQTSQRIRVDVDRGMSRARRRLEDLDALAEVVQEEVEETALDVASRVRSFRTGTSVIGRLRRLFRRGRR
jgi:uncharacterized protein YoxC